MLCPYCGAEAVLKEAKYVYHSDKSKQWGKVLVCSNYPKCDSYVRCHKDTCIPMGRLANARLRMLKAEAHKMFDPIWKNGYMTRRNAYKWLAQMLDIPLDQCHIGMFDIKQCQMTIYLCKGHLSSFSPKWTFK